MAVKVAACSIVVHGGARIGMAGEDLCIMKMNAGVERVGGCCVAKRVLADVAWDLGGFGDALHHPVGVAAVDWVAGGRAQDQRTGGPLAATGFQHPQDWRGQQCFAVVLDRSERRGQPL